MGRTINSGLMAAMSGGLLQPAFFAQLTFRSQTVYAWTGVGPIVVNSQTYLGVGSLAEVGAIGEGVDVNATGTSVTLSGIDPNILNECLTDIKSGAAANIWFGALANGVVIATYLLFSGVVDKPSVTMQETTASITLALESRLLDLGRATQRRYTAADQNVVYPTDIAFNWVEILSDAAWNWGKLMLKRTTCWDTKEFNDFLLEREKAPFAWGTNDCCLFPADAIKAFTGHDLAEDFRGKYSDQVSAFALIKLLTGGTTVEDAAAYCAHKAGLVERKPTALYAQRGDLVVVQNGQSLIAGIVHPNGRHVISVGEEGLLRMPLRSAKRAWKV